MLSCMDKGKLRIYKNIIFISPKPFLMPSSSATVLNLQPCHSEFQTDSCQTKPTEITTEKAHIKQKQ